MAVVEDPAAGNRQCPVISGHCLWSATAKPMPTAIPPGIFHPMNTSVLIAVTVVLVSLLAGFAYTLSRRKSYALADAGHELRSTPDYYGWYTISLMFLPVAAVSLILAIAGLADWFTIPGPIVAAGWIALPALALYPALQRIKPQLEARVLVERVIYGLLLAAASVSIITTIGILLSVLFESLRFFAHENITVAGFLFGTNWSPGESFLESMGRSSGARESHFGAVPLFYGTFVITFLAMLVAVPIGLLSAIFLSQYAGIKTRRVAKPLLEVLAGIPTVVYGFFAAITVAPIIVTFGESIGLDPEYQNALAPGLIMGVMIIPFMSSLCDDVISAVPENMRKASMALGATQSETITKVLLPAAMPGIISAFLLAVSRAIGETMIVVMAAGLMANITPNVFKEMTTVTVHIVDSLTGDQAYDNPQTLSAFALGLTLLILTLTLNVVSLFVVRRFRQQYEGD